jgi:hypothetical protein
MVATKPDVNRYRNTKGMPRRHQVIISRLRIQNKRWNKTAVHRLQPRQELRHPEKYEQHIQGGTRKQQRRRKEGDQWPQRNRTLTLYLESKYRRKRATHQEKWKTCKDDTMTTTANELGEREEEKWKQDKETEGKTDWTWICTSNDEKNEIRF